MTPWIKLSYFRTHYFRRRLRRYVKIAATGFCGVFFLLLFIASVEQKCPPQGCGTQGSYVQKLGPREDRPNSDVKRILRWTGFFGDMTWEATDDTYFRSCKVSQCSMTNDRSQLRESDAVLFHVGALWNFWKGFTLPTEHPHYQTWILYNVEPPPRVPLNLRSFGNVFNWTAWYRRDSDVPVAYGGFSEFTLPPSIKLNKSMTPNWALENNRFSAWMSSNCFDYNRRQLIVFELKKLLGDKMHLYGKCGGTRCPETICYDTLSNYKFFFTFENCNCRDYISEKFWAALLRRQLPVVLGGSSPADYAKIAPRKSFIHVNDFETLEELVTYLKYLDKNDTAYNEHMAWTSDHDVYSELPARRKWWCDLCEALHDRKRPAQVYTDIDGWMTDDTCPQWSLSNQLGRLWDGFKIKVGIL